MISVISLYHTCCDTSTKLMMGMYLCSQEIPHEIDQEGVSMALSAAIVLSYKFFGYLLEQFAPKALIFKSNEFIVFVYVWKTLSVSCTTYFLGKEKKKRKFGIVQKHQTIIMERSSYQHIQKGRRK